MRAGEANTYGTAEVPELPMDASIEKPTVLDELAMATPKRVETAASPVVRSARLIHVGPLDVTIAWRGSNEELLQSSSGHIRRDLARGSFTGDCAVPSPDV